MKRIEHFVPGIPDEDAGILDHLRWPIPAGVTQAYVAAYTEPGEQVLVPYCQGSRVVRESLSAGRRPLALHFDPLVILLVRMELAPPRSRELDAAVARLGDSLKQGVPLRHYLAELYATTCPACLRPAVADYFMWDREQGQPVAKYVRCRGCGWDGQAAVEQEDWERLKELPSREMHYHYLLDRVAPLAHGEGLRTRMEFLLELYSARNLYALAELTRRIESLASETRLMEALKVLLLDCLDRCSSLAPLPGSTIRRRGLARPRRFLERNVWHALEEAAVRLNASVDKGALPLAGTLEAFLSPAGSVMGYVGHGLVRDLSRTLPPRSLGLILTSPPPLDSAAWSLSYLWGAWLLGSQAVASLRPLLRQRTPDPSWYARVMTGSLAALADLTRDDGRLVMILDGQRPPLVEALVLAANQARLGVASLVQRGSDCRMELTPAFPQAVALAQPVTIATEDLETRIRQAAVKAASDTIRAWGEPVPWSTLHAAIQWHLSGSGLLARVSEPGATAHSALDLIAEQCDAALDDAALVRLVADESHAELWWLAEPGDVGPALCDRVEAAVCEALLDALALTEPDFTAKVYERFPGVLTPDAELVSTCLRAYGYEPASGYWQLRQEDLPAARQTEWQAIVEDLLGLGLRLGYRAEAWAPFDAVWLENGSVRAVFVVRWKAVVSEALALSEQAAGARPYLVIPGGRAALVSYKLAHNPLWRRAVDKAGWWFIKYRHVRQLVGQEEVNEYSLRTIVGLDPIVERETAQLPLF